MLLALSIKRAPLAPPALLLLLTCHRRCPSQIGIMGFVAESKVPGSVPALTGLIKPFAGDVMAPLA